MSKVRQVSGVPTSDAFKGADGSPIVVDKDTGDLYFLKTGNTVVKSASVNVTTNAVLTSGDQTVAGVKTFSSAIVGSTNSQVSLTGDQTVAGVKTFSSPVGVAAAVATGDAVQLAQLNDSMATGDDYASRAFTSGVAQTNNSGRMEYLAIRLATSSTVGIAVGGVTITGSGLNTGTANNEFFVLPVPPGKTWTITVTGGSCAVFVL